MLSVVVMHHPARAQALPPLLAACAPLPVRVVEDPAPDGPASPLRTAKRAWAAVAEGATHHVVLQDDVVPVPGFAEHLVRAIEAKPDCGVTFSVQGTSPRNAYAVRRAAVAGRAWARMSVVEWTPTLALGLPAADARALAAYFAELPDELLEDDDFVTPFCASRSLPVFATVPNLVEHAGLPSLSGYEVEGDRPVTVFDGRWSVPAGHWSDPRRGPLPALVETGTGDVAVDLRESRCGLRFLRPGTAEPLEHPFTWDWQDWAVLVGVNTDEVLEEWECGTGATGRPPAVNPSLALEVWAAAFLLAALVQGASPALATDDFRLLVLRRAVASWLDLGLAAADRSVLGPRDVTALVEHALSGVAAGRAHGSEQEVTGVR